MAATGCVCVCVVWQPSHELSAGCERKRWVWERAARPLDRAVDVLRAQSGKGVGLVKAVAKLPVLSRWRPHPFE